MTDRNSSVGAKAPALSHFDAILSGQSVTESAKTARGTFLIKYPSGRDRLRMDQLRAFRRNGLPSSAFDVEGLFNNEKWSTLDVCVIDGPDWFRQAKANNQNWTWEDCPDEQLTTELYARIESFRKKVAGNLGGPVEAPENSVGTRNPENVGDGAFSGLAYGSSPSGA